MHQNTAICLLSFCIASLSLFAQAPLSMIYGSGSYTGTQGPANDVLAFSDGTEQLIVWENGAHSYQQMQEWFGPNWWTATVNGETPYPYIGFKKTAGNPRINPVYWNGTATPALPFFTDVTTDAAGDHLFTNTALDLLGLRVSFSDDKLHFAIRNSSGSYPTSSGALTYYSYMAVLVDPDAEPGSNPIVYGLMYTVSVTGVIGPGLYKITGSGLTDQVLIGQLTANVLDSNLILTCNLSDLVADPDFSSWFDTANPRVSAVAMTTRITLSSGVQQADVTDSVELLFKPQPLPTQNTSQPVLGNARVDSGWVSDVFYVQGYVDYADADNNFPRWASFSLDGGDPQPLHILSPFPMSFNQDPVHYVTQMIPAPPGWSEARFRFANGDSFVESIVINQVANSDPTIPAAPLKLHPYPNPVIRSLKLEVSGADLVDLSIYNLKGQRLYHQESFKSLSEIDLSAYPAGVYILKAISLNASHSRKIVKLP